MRKMRVSHDGFPFVEREYANEVKSLTHSTLFSIILALHTFRGL